MNKRECEHILRSLSAKSLFLDEEMLIKFILYKRGNLIMSESHTLLEDIGPAVIQTLLEELRPGAEYFIKRERENRHPKYKRVVTKFVTKDKNKSGSSGGSPSNILALPASSNSPLLPAKINTLSKDNSSGGGGSGGGSSNTHPKSPRGSIGKYLLGLGALGATGAGAYALRDKLGDAADEAGEHINSLRDKLANIIAAHHEA
jgi:hypothetical protein